MCISQSLLYSIVGGLLSGAFALLAAWIGIRAILKQEADRRNYERQAQQSALANALAADIKALWDRYLLVMGNTLDATPEGKFDTCAVLLTESYFAVFDSNADKVGLLDEEAAAAVVQAYQHAKGFVDSIRTWNGILECYTSQPPQKTQHEALEYWDGLREEHKRLKEMKEDVLTRLAKYARRVS